MTMFDPDTPDIDKKLQEIEDEMKQIEQIPPIRESEWYFCTHF